MRRYRVVFDLWPVRIVRHVRASDDAHARDQAARIEAVLAAAGFSIKQAVTR